MEPSPSRPLSAVLGRVSIASGVLGVVLYAAGAAAWLRPDATSRKIGSDDAVILVGLLSPIIGSFALLVAALTGIWAFAFSSPMPRPILLGRVSLWSAVLGVVGSVLPYVVPRGPLEPSAVAVALSIALNVMATLGSWVAMATGIESLFISLSTQRLESSGLVGFGLGLALAVWPVVVAFVQVVASHWRG